ncbi:MAG: fructose PTS transporter subunit IIB, partial [Allobaculum sp.]|nr:fructose PTS transporter subunit IIB [Allobaculum sp.]
SGRINDRTAYQKEVFHRETEGTTGVGGGIAIPHGRSEGVSKPGLAALVIPEGVDYEALDGAPVNLLFLIAAPNDGNVHLEVLANLSRMLMDPTLSEKLVNAKSPEQFLNLLETAENAILEKEAAKSAPVIETNASSAPLILAVTGCPTGIAHTYMAAEAIENKAKELGYRVKVETRGSGGAKNILTPEEIRQADAIIVAADTKVPMERFDGKKVIKTQVKDGISKPQSLIEQGLSDTAPIYHASGATSEEASAGNESGWHKVYTDLMNGVSNMLPFVVGGGLLIAIAFLLDGLFVNVNALPEAERAAFGTITPAAAFFKDLGGVAFGFMLPVLAGFISMSIADR